MSVIIQHVPCHFAAEDSHVQKVKAAHREQEEAPFKVASCFYTEKVQSKNFEVKDLSEQKWREAQQQRLLAPVGTRVLLRRRYHETVVQDTMMVRVNQMYRWECLHIFYVEDESTPLPVHAKMYKYGCK